MYVSDYKIFDHEYIKEYGNDRLLIPYYELVKDSYMVNKYGLTFYLCKKYLRIRRKFYWLFRILNYKNTLTILVR